MAKYIDRDAFLAKERAWYCENCDRRKNSKGKMVYEIGEAPCRACNIDDVLDDLEDYHASDVRPVRLGKLEKYGAAIRCSECGFDTQSWDVNFCPNCGAKMEEDPFVDSPPMEYFESGGI